MFAKTAIVALFAAFAAAQLHAPVGDAPDGSNNAITRPLNEAVTAGTPFTIEWTPTTDNTVSLLLVKGPPNNVNPIGEPIVEGIDNSGSFTWTPPAEFGPGDSETTGYGIQLIDDVTGLYQYSTQFGITIPEGYESDDEEETSSSAAPSSTKGDSYPTKSVSTKDEESSKATPTVTKSIYTAPTIAPTGSPAGNTTVIQPTKPITKPSSLLTSATASSTETSPPQSTGAASHLQAGLGLAAGVAGLFFML